MNKFLKRIFIIICSCVLLSGIFVLSILWVFSSSLPDYKFLKNYKPPVSSKVYSGEGELVGDFSSAAFIIVAAGIFVWAREQAAKSVEI